MFGRFPGVLRAITVIFFCSSSVLSDSPWHYHGDQSHWAERIPTCGSASQSPIDIKPAETVVNSTLGGDNLQFRSYDSFLNSSQFLIENYKGRTVQLSIINASAGITINNVNYTLAQFHFHWGEEIERGSEHTINGAAYPLELHLVHYNSDKYSSFDQAQNESDGLAVIGVLVQISEEPSPTFETIISTFKNIAYQGLSTDNIPHFQLQSLLPNQSYGFFRYSGSLTTPPCYESVTWTVFRYPLTISSEQLKSFRESLHANSTGENTTIIVDNFRPTQPLNSRTVYRNFTDTNIQWNYDEGSSAGPKNWKNLNPVCGWSHQSPINVNSTAAASKPFESWVMRLVGSAPFTALNTGRTVEILVGPGMNISGGGLSGVYVLDKIVFHWGETDLTGSEHSVDGKFSPIEIQLVHHHNNYTSLKEASAHDNGIAILAVLADITNTSMNVALNNTVNALSAIQSSGSNTSLNAFDVSELLPNVSSSNVYRYNGSMTSPTCAETVIWTVFADPIFITSSQVSKFRQLVSTSGTQLIKNYRPVQPLNNRDIYRMSPAAPLITTATPTSSTTPKGASERHVGRRLVVASIALASAMLL